MTLIPQFDLEHSNDMFTLSVTRGGIFAGKIITDNIEALMRFAIAYDWGQYGNRQKFETEVMKKLEVNQFVFELDLHKN